MIRGLPEFIALTQVIKIPAGDITIDGPIPLTPGKEEQRQLGKNAWQVDVYIEEHVDPDTSRGRRWAFFRINAVNGEIFVDDFDFERGSFILKSLQEWRRNPSLSRRADRA